MNSWRITLLGAALCVLPAAAAAPQRAASIPDALTDREFWRLFTTLSEEGGAFPSENFVSNEKTYQFVIPTLQRALTPNGVYLGVGPEQNFTYIVNLQPRLAVIFDIRRQNAMLHLMYKALFELSPSRPVFVSRLFSRPVTRTFATTATPAEIFDAVAAAPVSDSAFDVNWKAIVQRLTVTHGFAMSADDLASMRRVFEAFREAGPEISYAFRVGSPPPTVTQWFVTYAQLQSVTNADSVNMAFLSTDERYRWLRSLESRNLVVPVVGDFGGAKAIRGVGDYLRQHGATVSAFYTSNVEQYLFTSGSDAQFYRSVAALPIDSTSRFIRSLPGNPVSSVLVPQPPRDLVNQRVDFTDSSGVRLFLSTGVDSLGNTVTTRGFVRIPAPTLASTSAFITGIAPIGRALEAFAAGQLTSYRQVTLMTKTEDWKAPP